MSNVAHRLIVSAILLAGGLAQADSLDRIYVVTKGSDGTGPELIAQRLPASMRGTGGPLAQQLLERYRAIEGKLKIRQDEPAGALAAFVIGNVGAFHHIEPSDKAISAAVTQLRSAARSNPSLVNDTEANRPGVAQEYAIVGLLMVGMQQNLAQHANPQLTRVVEASARNYMQTYLGVDVSQIRITDTGLAWTGEPQGLLASINARLSGGRAQQSPQPEPPQTAAASTSTSIPPIERVVFDYTTQMGVGGYFYYTAYPIVLFKNHEALTDMAQLTNVAADKQAHPRNWTHWRMAGDRVQLQNTKGWKTLDAGSWTALSRGTKLDRTYTKIGGGGNTAYGGGTMIMTWRSMKFDASGHFSSGGGTSASSHDPYGHGGGVVANSNSDPNSGTYEISGFTLTLRFNDGRVVTRAIVFDPKSAKVIWIDGAGYTS